MLTSMTNDVLATSRTRPTDPENDRPKTSIPLTATSPVKPWVGQGQPRTPARSPAHKVPDQLYSVIPHPRMTLSTTRAPRGYQLGTVNQAATPGYCPGRPSEIRAGISRKASSLRHHYGLPLGNRPTAPDLNLGPFFLSLFFSGSPFFSLSWDHCPSFFFFFLSLFSPHVKLPPFFSKIYDRGKSPLSRIHRGWTAGVRGVKWAVCAG